MNFNLLLPSLVAAGVTFILNVIFYIWIKRSVDSRIEKFKIAYSGIFKERIEVYREVLSRMKELIRLHIQFVEKEPGNIHDFNVLIRNKNLDFSDFYTINQAFLSDKVIQEANNLQEILRNFYDAVYSNYVAPESFRNTEAGRSKLAELIDEHFKAMNSLKNSDTFKRIEDVIVTEMKRDLHIDFLS